MSSVPINGSIATAAVIGPTALAAAFGYLATGQLPLEWANQAPIAGAMFAMVFIGLRWADRERESNEKREREQREHDEKREREQREADEKRERLFLDALEKRDVTFRQSIIEIGKDCHDYQEKCSEALKKNADALSRNSEVLRMLGNGDEDEDGE